MIPNLQLAQFGRAGQSGIVGANPYWANVQIQIHFDGSDGSTTFTDVKGHTVTANLDAQIDTAQSHAGGASGLFDGTGDYLRIPGSPDFYVGSGDWTVECFVRPSDVSGLHFLAGPRIATGADVNWYWGISAGVLFFTAYGPTSGTVLANFSGGTITTGGAFQHVAMCRSGSTWRLLHEGSVVAITTASGSVYDASEDFLIGKDASTAGREYAGHMDEFRFTVGAALYTGSYTVPTAPFPDS